MPLKLPFLLFYCLSLTLVLSPRTIANAEELNSKVEQLELELKKLNLRVGNVELKNNDQDDAILFLKTRRDATFSNMKQNEFIEPRHHHAYYESNNKSADYFDDGGGGGKGTMRQKRPFRLLPASQPKMDEQKQLVSGPPSSCEDINTLGHTLNGIYLAKDLDGSKIKAIFCDFQTRARALSSADAITMKEKALGYVDVKSASGVYFYVQAFGSQSIGGNGVLPFNKIVLNIGGGMNLKSGVFTAPRSGTYAFFYSILKNGYNFSVLDVSLRVNGIRIGNFFAGAGLLALPIVQQATLKLKKGDRIDLQKGKSGGLSDCPMGHCHHFSGWMLEEDLEL